MWMAPVGAGRGLFFDAVESGKQSKPGAVAMCYRPLPMRDNKKPPLNFDPRAALLINQQKFVLKITVDMTTGQMVMDHEGPDLGALAVLDLLNTQAQVILRQLILNPNFPNPSLAPAGGSNIGGGEPGGANGGSNPA